jgi:hypothetical protein
MSQLLIRTMNPRDISFEETEEIAALVRKLDPQLEVQVEEHHKEGYGVTWFQVLRIEITSGLWAR